MKRFINFIATALLLVLAWVVGMALVGWVFNFLGTIATLTIFGAGVLVLSWWLTRGTGKKKQPDHIQPVGPS